MFKCSEPPKSWSVRGCVTRIRHGCVLTMAVAHRQKRGEGGRGVVTATWFALFCYRLCWVASVAWAHKADRAWLTPPIQKVITKGGGGTGSRAKGYSYALPRVHTCCDASWYKRDVRRSFCTRSDIDDAAISHSRLAKDSAGLPQTSHKVEAGKRKPRQ